MMWTREAAAEVIALLQPLTRQFGYHLALGGGVLNNGHSDKDLDLYFLPLDDQDHPPNPDKMLRCVEAIWGESKPLSDYPKASSLYAHKRKLTLPGHKRVDVFIAQWHEVSE